MPRFIVSIRLRDAQLYSLNSLNYQFFTTMHQVREFIHAVESIEDVEYHVYKIEEV